tara:strand:- start:642 stop:797 length:156 start_codon:yes stop_codon:yes gene_type:complete
MRKYSKVIQKHRIRAQASINKKGQLQRALAQIDAALSRKEYQKVIEKSQSL